MKKKIVCRKLRASKIVARNMTNREIGWVKNKIGGKSTWYAFGQYLQMARIIADAEHQQTSNHLED